MRSGSDFPTQRVRLCNWRTLADGTVDLDKDRVYIPLEIIERHGYSLDALRAGECNDAFRAVMRDIVSKARELFLEGLL